MHRFSIKFLQAVIILSGISALALLIRLPLTEGRAANLDFLSIYSDPFILYIYGTSILFFAGLYKAFRLSGYLGHKEIFTLESVRSIRSIRYCAIAFSILLVIAGVYIKLFHASDDDPAGFLALCLVITFISLVMATAAAILETILKKGMEMKSEKG